MEPDLKFGHDAEVATASTQSPIKIGILFCVGRDHGTVRRNQGEAVNVIAREPMQAIEPSGAS